MSHSPQDIIYGRWPVKEALESGPVQKIIIAKGSHGKGLDDIYNLARQKKVPFQQVERKKLDQLIKGNHQGILAYVSPVSVVSYASLLDEALGSSGNGPCLLYLDGIQDPQNVGSIIRTAVFMGVYGVVLPKWRAAPLTGSVVRSSAGAARLIAIAQVSNLTNALILARKKGLWIVGADRHGENVRKISIPRPFGLVLGSEGEGLHRLVKENCDYLVSIAGAESRRGIDSLNVSVACGVLLHYFS